MVWIAVGVGAILMFTALHREIDRFRELNQEVCHFIYQIVSVISNFLVGVLKRLFSWVSQAEVETPKNVLIGVIGLVIGVGVGYADLHVVRETLPVVFPFEMSGTLLAIVIVGLTAVCGLYFHSIESRLLRTLIGVAAVMLCLFQGGFAYKRELERQKIEFMDDQIVLPATSVSTIMIEGEAVETVSMPDSSSPVHRLDWTSIVMAAALGFFIPFAEILVFWASTSQCAGAIVYFLSAIVALPLAVVTLPFYLLGRIVGEENRIAKIGEVVLRLLHAIASIPFNIADGLEGLPVQRRERAEQGRVQQHSFQTAALERGYVASKTKKDVQAKERIDEQLRQHRIEVDQMIRAASAEAVKASAQLINEAVVKEVKASLNGKLQEVAELVRDNLVKSYSSTSHFSHLLAKEVEHASHNRDSRS
jgi:hypothetical protein